MSFRAEDLIPSQISNLPMQSLPRKRWMIAQPVPAPLIVRIREAWLVLTGKAEIIVWPEQER